MPARKSYQEKRLEELEALLQEATLQKLVAEARVDSLLKVREMLLTHLTHHEQ